MSAAIVSPGTTNPLLQTPPPAISTSSLPIFPPSSSPPPPPPPSSPATITTQLPPPLPSPSQPILRLRFSDSFSSLPSSSSSSRKPQSSSQSHNTAVDTLHVEHTVILQTSLSTDASAAPPIHRSVESLHTSSIHDNSDEDDMGRYTTVAVLPPSGPLPPTPPPEDYDGLGTDSGSGFSSSDMEELRQLSRSIQVSTPSSDGTNDLDHDLDQDQDQDQNQDQDEAENTNTTTTTTPPTKRRILDGKSGKELTPWPTPRIGQLPESEDEESEDGTAAFARAVEEFQLRSLSLPLSLPTVGARVTRSYSQNRHRPQSQPQTYVDESQQQDDGQRGSLEAPRRGSTASSTVPVVIHTTLATPPTAAAAPSLPSPPLPVLNIIPATPMPLSPTAEKDKQLTGRSLLQRRPTGLGTPAPVIEEADAEHETAPVSSSLRGLRRPSLAAVPKKLRDSKLHPWWRPKGVRSSSSPSSSSVECVQCAECGAKREVVIVEPSKTASAGEGVSAGVSEGVSGGVSATPNGPPRRRRIQKRIKGTNLVVEFIGWRGIGEAMRRPLKGILPAR